MIWYADCSLYTQNPAAGIVNVYPAPEQMMFWLSGPGLVGLAGMRRFNR
jgi:hypothetical protein